jgi:RimJ/RimL family protein N-acetyltransferase
MTVFETERLLIRQYTRDDFEYFFRLNNNEDVMRYIRPVQDREQSGVFFEQILKDYTSQPGLGRWAMFEKNSTRFLGSFAIIPVVNTDFIQLGYALLKENWGRGYADESVKGGIRYAFDHLSLRKIAAITESENIASQKVLLKNGFVFQKEYEENEKKLYFYLLKKSGIRMIRTWLTRRYKFVV